MFTFIGFRLDLGSSLVDLQQIPVVVGAVECGCGNIVIITSDIHSNQGLCGTIIQNGLVLRELIVGTKTISCEE